MTVGAYFTNNILRLGLNWKSKIHVENLFDLFKGGGLSCKQSFKVVAYLRMGVILQQYSMEFANSVISTLTGDMNKMSKAPIYIDFLIMVPSKIPS